jgi:dihydroorotase
MASASRNTPFAGREMHGRVVATFLRGRATVLDGHPVRQTVGSLA